MTSETKRPSKEEVLAKLRAIRAGLRVTKITSSRTVKSRNGDSFVGFSASYRTFQGETEDDSHVASDEDLSEERGATLSDAKLARYVLSMECDVAALESAMINGGITQEYFRDAVRGVQNGYNQLILREMGVVTDDSKG
jgi:hypothetical protein